MENKKIVAVASDELLDADLKKILGKRYEDMSDKFTPEAQERRRNNRVVFTLKITAFICTLILFLAWCDGMSLMAHSVASFGISICALVIGYFLGVCVSHIKGWRD